MRYLLESRCAISFDLIAGNGVISPLCYHTYNVRPLISADYLCIHSIYYYSFTKHFNPIQFQILTYLLHYEALVLDPTQHDRPL